MRNIVQHRRDHHCGPHATVPVVLSAPRPTHFTLMSPAMTRSVVQVLEQRLGGAVATVRGPGCPRGGSRLATMERCPCRTNRVYALDGVGAEADAPSSCVDCAAPSVGYVRADDGEVFEESPTGGRMPPSLNNLSTGLLGCAPTPNQYLMRSTLHSTVFVSWPSWRRGLRIPRVSMGFALRRLRWSMATRWRIRRWVVPCIAKRIRTAMFTMRSRERED